MKNILVALDFSEITPQVIATAKELALGLKAKLAVIHIDYLMPFLNQYGINHVLALEAFQAQLKKSEEYLRSLEDELMQAGIDTTCQLVQGTTIDSILSETDKIAADLVIIGAHPHGKLHNLLFGNIHEAIVERINCPIVIVPCHKQKEGKNAN